MIGDVEHVLEAVRPRLLLVLARYRIPAGEGDDLIQDVLIAALSHWDQIDNKEAWLVTVLRNRCSIYLRRQVCWNRLLQSMDPVELQAIAKPLDPPQEHQDVCRDLKRLARTLSAKEIRLLRLRFGQDLGRGEVASLIGCHPANVPKILRRILARLKSAAITPLS